MVNEYICRKYFYVIDEEGKKHKLRLDMIESGAFDYGNKHSLVLTDMETKQEELFDARYDVRFNDEEDFYKNAEEFIKQYARDTCTVDDWTEEYQEFILEKFFFECVRFWERELKTDRDLDKRPYENAIKEIAKHDPSVPNGRLIDENVRNLFKQYRLMDTYGVDWEKHWNEYSAY